MKPKTLINAQRLQVRIRELARQISKDYKGKKLVLVSVLKGSFIFLADLIRCLSIPAEIDFVQVSSYGAGRKSSGVITFKKELELPVKKKHVLLVEDIVDYGYTVEYVSAYLKAEKPKSVKICALLDKPSRRKTEISIAYRGFVVPDKFLVGYGLDYAEQLRGLPYVAALT